MQHLHPNQIVGQQARPDLGPHHRRSFGDADRNNDGAINALDTDTIDKPIDAQDTGIAWFATRGHTSNGDRKAYVTVVDDSSGDADSPGLQSGYALGIELLLERSAAASYQGDPAGLFTATVIVDELDAKRSIVGTHRFGDPDLPKPDTDGVQSDGWDYIGFQNSGGDPEQDYDMVIDNVSIRMVPASTAANDDSK